VGFDIEIAKIIAHKLGIKDDKIKWTETVSANREQFITSGQVDIAVATYTINDKRKEIVSFAGPYYVAGQSILTLKSNKDIKGPDDLAGKKVCTVSGSTPEANLIANYPKADVVPFGTYAECLEPLKDGQVDAVSTDNVILAGFAADNKDLEVRGKPFTAEPYGIGLAKDAIAVRMSGKVLPLQHIQHLLHRLVFKTGQLLQLTVAHFLRLSGIKERIARHLDEQRHELLQVTPKCKAGVPEKLGTGRCIVPGAKILERLGQIANAPIRGALKGQPVDEVGYSCLTLPLITRPGCHAKAYGKRFHAMHRLRYDTQTVVKGVSRKWVCCKVGHRHAHSFAANHHG